METPIPQTIVSGGQTGADRAALDWALSHGIPTGGWCPADRLAEDGRIPDRYPLKETNSTAYIVRTEWNVRDSDATLLFSLADSLSGGSAETLAFCQQMNRPFLHLSQARDLPASAAEKLSRFLSEHRPATLNIAGPRASEEPEIGGYVEQVLELAFPAPFPT